MYGKKKQNCDNLEEQENRYNTEKERHRQVYKEAEMRYLKQLQELQLTVEANEKRYLAEYNALKQEIRDHDLKHQEYVKKLNYEYTVKIELLTTQMEEMRIIKETEISQLTIWLES